MPPHLPQPVVPMPHTLRRISQVLADANASLREAVESTRAMLARQGRVVGTEDAAPLVEAVQGEARADGGVLTTEET